MQDIKKLAKKLYGLNTDERIEFVCYLEGSNTLLEY